MERLVDSLMIYRMVLTKIITSLMNRTIKIIKITTKILKSLVNMIKIKVLRNIEKHIIISIIIIYIQ
jgi:hypothetical protein